MALTDNLVSYYKMDEAAGNALDSCDGHNGTVTGCTQNQAGKINTAYTFDGNDYITIPNHADFKMGTGDFSLQAWFKTTSTGSYKRIISCHTATALFIIRVTNDNKINGLVRSPGFTQEATGTTTVTGGGWFHIVLSFDRSENSLKLWLNGNNEATGGAGVHSGSIDPTADVYIGTYNISTENFVGTIDEVAIWKGVCLTQAQAQALYNGGSGVAYPLANYTKLQINVGDAWKSCAGAQINIGDAWKTIAGMQINIGDAWKTIF